MNVSPLFAVIPWGSGQMRGWKEHLKTDIASGESEWRKQMNTEKLRKLVTLGLLTAVIVILSVTGLGNINLPIVSCTITHAPVIIGTLLLGLSGGMVLSGVFGFMSFYMAFQIPQGLNVCFMNPAIAILPRLMIPLVTYLVAKALGFYRRDNKKIALPTAVAAAAGSMANTVFVFAFLSIFYGETVMQVIGADSTNLLPKVAALGATLGIPEAIVIAIVTTAVVKALVAVRPRAAAAR